MSRARTDIEKKTLNLRRGDWEYISSIAQPNGLFTSDVIRMLVSKFVDDRRAEEPQFDPPPDLEL